MNEAGRPPDSQAVDLALQILARRGYSKFEAEGFLRPDYDRGLHDPFLMRDMDVAVDRIQAAVVAGEQVAVYGDYDIDGITATAVLCEGLQALGLMVRPYIPDRFEEGYGINQPALAQLKEAGASLIISVDCGITSVSEAAWAREHGLDLIITDHHAVPEVLPNAVAILNPKRADDTYPFKELAGVGVAFKLVQALQQRMGKPAPGQEKWLLDLVALGTVCDVVSLTGENRVLVTYGLKVLRRTRRVGLRALAAEAGIALDAVRTYHLGFGLGPRMNAAGRLEHANSSLELIQTADTGRAQVIANELEVLNQQRRDTQKTIVETAGRLAAAYESDPVLVLADADWSHGIVGIVASKVAEAHGKPTLIAQVLGDRTKGSARSVPGFNMVEALRAHGELFERLGGHAFAAGFTLPTDQLDELRRRLNQYYHDHPSAMSASKDQRGEVVLADFEQLDWPMLEAFELLEPFGTDNPEPLVEVKNFTVDRSNAMGAQGQHIRLVMRDQSGRSRTAVGFGMGERKHELSRPNLRFTGNLNKNEYQGSTSLQFLIRGMHYE
jgi:single-stranded-DNA-specific exonuclease